MDESLIKSLFTGLDPKREGKIDYLHFLTILRGRMSGFRSKLVELTFNRLQPDFTSPLSLPSLTSAYSGKNHPDVRSGKKSEEEAVAEFLETLEMYLSYSPLHLNDKIITKQEFEDFYSFVSAVIEDDKYFELLLTNGWKLYGDDQRGKERWNELYHTKPGERAYNVSAMAPFGTSNVPTDYSTWLRPKPVQMKAPLAAAGYSVRQKPEVGASISDRQLLLLFRQNILARGARGIFGVKKYLKMTDRAKNGKITIAGMKNLVKEFRLKMKEDEVENLFKVFDREKRGEIFYDDLICAGIGEMSQQRKNLVTKVFKELDKTGSGYVLATELKSAFDPSRHPEVVLRKKTEDDVLNEFLDTFEEHYSLIVRETVRNNLFRALKKEMARSSQMSSWIIILPFLQRLRTISTLSL